MPEEMKHWTDILEEMWGNDTVPYDLVEFCERVRTNIKKTDPAKTLRSTEVIALIVELYRTGMNFDLIPRLRK